MSASTAFAAWIAVEWGEDTLRAWAIGADGAIRARAEATLTPAAGYADGGQGALFALIGDWLGMAPMPVLATGMFGTVLPPAEGRCLPVPAKPGALGPVDVPGWGGGRVTLSVIPALAQADPADLLQAEVAQIAGYLAQDADFDGVLCLVGTRSAWVQISAAEVVSFQTTMSGRLIDLVATQMGLSPEQAAGTTDLADFDAALADILSDPRRLAQRLSGLRAASVLEGAAPARLHGRLAGALIGAELAATRPYWLGQQVVVAGAPGLAVLYQRALTGQGVALRMAPWPDLALAGLAHARNAAI